jgi:5-methyltetrahydropteroyltriglutamate--homocysteine methyltransferase
MKPPFRADHVGSLLRPAALGRAREQFRRGEIDAATLRAAEDTAIRAVVARQESIGLQSITDGELRRDFWHLDFMKQLDGVTLETLAGPKFGKSGEQPKIATITGKVDFTTPVQLEDFRFLKGITQRTAKFTMPSPGMLHLRGGRKAISRAVYPDIAEFWRDASAAYAKAIAAFAAAGCSYLQLDDVGFSYLCDENFRANCRENGDDPATLPRDYARAINDAVRNRPAGMAITMHTCRGNFQSSWVTSGGYENVAEAMFSADIDGFFMEFDSARAGTFEPLRYLPKDKKVVLGLVTTKLGQLESRDEILRRIEAATQYVPLESLCLSPQCGFASTHHGNALSEDEQWRKLALIVEVAQEVWGGR